MRWCWQWISPNQNMLDRKTTSGKQGETRWKYILFLALKYNIFDWLGGCYPLFMFFHVKGLYCCRWQNTTFFIINNTMHYILYWLMILKVLSSSLAILFRETTANVRQWNFLAFPCCVICFATPHQVDIQVHCQEEDKTDSTEIRWIYSSIVKIDDPPLQFLQNNAALLIELKDSGFL